MLSHSELLERLSYNPGTGEVHWTRSPLNRAVVRGKRAGTINARGYRVIGLDGVSWFEHRLIWYYMTGEIPEEGIDHRDRNSANNRWKNLRQASQSQNGENRGFTGLSWHSRDQYWNVCLQKNGKRFYDQDCCFGRALKKRNALKEAQHEFGMQSAG